MSELYRLDDELPPDLADTIVDEEKPVGPPGDPDTATADEDDE